MITISNNTGILDERESNLSNLYPESKTNLTGNNPKVIEKNVRNHKNDIRPFKFHNKKAVFVSARVHPGETQSSFVMRGLIKFLLRPNDPRAIMLRKKYVFKLIPMLNPDGVFQGHYRTDSNGVNLNRVYARPDLHLHPTIYAARKLLMYVHHGMEIEEKFDSEADEQPTAEEDELEEELSQEDSITVDDLHITYGKSNANLPLAINPILHNDLSLRKNCFDTQNTPPSTSQYIRPPIVQSSNQQEKIQDNDLFLEPSGSLRIRRDSARSGEFITGGGHSDTRWLRSHRRSAMLDGSNSPTVMSGTSEGPSGSFLSSSPGTGNSSNLSTMMNWYEMTETSRCSEGDESVADFSVCHPNSSSAAIALAAAVGVKPSKMNTIPTMINKTSPYSNIEGANGELRNLNEANKIANCLSGSVGNSSSYQRATSFAGAFSSLTGKGNSNIQPSTFQPILNSNFGSLSPIRRLTFDDDLETDLDMETSNGEHKYDIDDKPDSDDGMYISKRTRAGSSTSAFDQEEENANLDFATNEKLPKAVTHASLITSLSKGTIQPTKLLSSQDISSPENTSKNTRRVTRPSSEGVNQLSASRPTSGHKESKKEKTKIYNSLCNKNKVNSNLFLYVDIHGHASKRGIFMYGNHFSDMDNKIASMLLPKLMSINSANFDFPACNFTERNMYLKDRHTGAGREGSGRVSAYKATGLVQSYTLECNFNTGRVVNCMPMASRDSGRATPPPPGTLNPENPSIPKYNPEIYEDAGKAMAVSILDLTEINPWTRLTCSACKNLKGVKEWLRKFIRHSEEQHNHKTPTKSSKGGGNYYSHGNTTQITSPIRSLRSGSATATRKVRTFSSNSVSGSNISHPHGPGANMNNVSKWVGSSTSKPISRGSGPTSPGSYRPVSKIARKNSLNTQQSQSPSNFRLDLSSLSKVGNTTSSTEAIARPKFGRSKSLTSGLTTQSENIPRLHKKPVVLKTSQASASVRKSVSVSNTATCKSKMGHSGSRSRSKGRVSKPTTQQRSTVDKHELPTMKWSHNGTLITHPLPPPQIKKITKENKKRSLSANQKKRRVVHLEKSTSSASITLGEVSSRSRGQSLGRKGGPRKYSSASSTSSASASITNIRTSTSIDVEKQILSLTGDSRSSDSSVFGPSFASSGFRVTPATSSISSGIGSSLTYENTTTVLPPKTIAPTKKRRTKRKKAS